MLAVSLSPTRRELLAATAAAGATSLLPGALRAAAAEGDPIRALITARRVFALAALTVATGVGTVEMTRNSAHAAEPTTMTRNQAYSAARVDTVFDLVAAMPARAPVMVPMASKGDLLVPPGCAGLTPDAQGECIDVAFEMDSAPSAVVETREGTTSTLLKLDPLTLAVVTDETLR